MTELVENIDNIDNTIINTIMKEDVLDLTSIIPDSFLFSVDNELLSLDIQKITHVLEPTPETAPSQEPEPTLVPETIIIPAPPATETIIIPAPPANETIIIPAPPAPETIIIPAPPALKKPENTLLFKLEEMVFYIKSVLGNDKITATNLVVITTNLMHVVEQYKDLTGYQKKMLIIDTIKKVINDTVGDNINDTEERIFLNTIVDLTVPPLIDTLVSAINGNIKFEKDKIISFFKKLFCCGSSKNKN